MTSNKRPRPPPTEQPSAALARLEMLAGAVLDAYGATDIKEKGPAPVAEPHEPQVAERQPERRRQRVAKPPSACSASPPPPKAVRPAEPESSAAAPPEAPPAPKPKAEATVKAASTAVGAKAVAAPAASKQAASGEKERRKELKDLPPPPISELRAAGWAAPDDTVRRVWAWAKEHDPDDLVWPCPTAGTQDPLRFDA